MRGPVAAVQHCCAHDMITMIPGEASTGAGVTTDGFEEPQPEKVCILFEADPYPELIYNDENGKTAYLLTNYMQILIDLIRAKGPVLKSNFVYSLR